MPEMSKLQGLVADVLNDREIAITLGSESGVSEGMKFSVREPNRTIVNPRTQEVLGSIQREKVKVKVVDVQRKFSVARTYETYTTGAETPISLLAQSSIWNLIGDSKGAVTRVRTLKSTERPAEFGEISEGDSYVKVGDPVFLIELPEDQNAPKQSIVAISLGDLLTQGRFRFVYAPETGRSKTIVFGKNGTILEGQNQNESSWRISNEQVEILNDKGEVFNRFKYDRPQKRFVATNEPSLKALKNQFFQAEK